jgi:hypothetical protein
MQNTRQLSCRCFLVRSGGTGLRPTQVVLDPSLTISFPHKQAFSDHFVIARCTVRTVLPMWLALLVPCMRPPLLIKKPPAPFREETWQGGPAVPRRKSKGL